ncbi:MAG: hypothetical protein ABIA04_12110 [Pseudomonadota bacterium]
MLSLFKKILYLVLIIIFSLFIFNSCLTADNGNGPSNSDQGSGDSGDNAGEESTDGSTAEGGDAASIDTETESESDETSDDDSTNSTTTIEYARVNISSSDFSSLHEGESFPFPVNDSELATTNGNLNFLYGDNFWPYITDPAWGFLGESIEEVNEEWLELVHLLFYYDIDVIMADYGPITGDSIYIEVDDSFDNVISQNYPQLIVLSLSSSDTYQYSISTYTEEEFYYQQVTNFLFNINSSGNLTSYTYSSLKDKNSEILANDFVETTYLTLSSLSFTKATDGKITFKKLFDLSTDDTTGYSNNYLEISNPTDEAAKTMRYAKQTYFIGNSSYQTAYITNSIIDLDENYLIMNYGEFYDLENLVSSGLDESADIFEDYSATEGSENWTVWQVTSANICETTNADFSAASISTSYDFCDRGIDLEGSLQDSLTFDQYWEEVRTDLVNYFEEICEDSENELANSDTCGYNYLLYQNPLSFDLSGNEEEVDSSYQTLLDAVDHVTLEDMADSYGLSLEPSLISLDQEIDFTVTH